MNEEFKEPLLDAISPEPNTSQEKSTFFDNFPFANVTFEVPHSWLQFAGFSSQVKHNTLRQVFLFNNQESGTHPHPHGQFAVNRIRTSKYTVLTFLPKNLIEQFSNLANVYFLFICFMQLIPLITISEGVPFMLIPLVTIIVITMIKDIYEDYQRHQSDSLENNQQVLVWREKEWTYEAWKNLRVGEIVKVEEDHFFPADLLLLKSSGKKGLCYVETKGLDGETNLKHKVTQKQLQELSLRENFLEQLTGELTCEAPNDHIYKFDGSFKSDLLEKPVPVSSENVLLRGSSLRNTDFIEGLIIYAGHESKVMMNSSNARFKMSKIEIITNYQILYIFIMDMLLSLACATVAAVIKTMTMDDVWYLGFWLEPALLSKFGVMIIQFFGSWVLIFTNFIPASLLVTIEAVKFAQGVFMHWEWRMYDQNQGIQASVQAQNLNEELGQVEYLFSDKTGTLTCNVMQFKKFSAGTQIYGSDQDMAPEQKLENVNFSDERLWRDFQEGTENFPRIKEVLVHLALCHSIIIDERKGSYNASSPDELALVNAAKFMGVEFLSRDEDNNLVVSFKGENQRFKLLNTLEFTSNRKRMSVIVQDSNGSIQLLCKGADSVILERLGDKTSHHVQETLRYIEEFAQEGLRTLLLAKKTIPKEVYESWNEKFQDVNGRAVQNREEQLEQVSDLIEQGLELVGSTAIEDKLQDGVSETIRFMKEAGIRVWVLTGDKVETAINIGYAAGLLENSMRKALVDSKDPVQIANQMILAEKQLPTAQQHYLTSALIISGDSLQVIQQKQELVDQFIDLADRHTAVLACRVSPKQKADIVNMIKHKYPTKTTLAIGDGANDVSMITTANVGIGIAGLEGKQAARSSDFVIGQFQFLKPLLFIHGREAYRRNAFIICYSFYKNMIFVTPQFWFGFQMVFSGQTLYEPFIYQFYNLVYTCVPIIYYALYDFEHEKEVFLRDPRLYQIGIRDLYMNTKTFWSWVAYGFWQAVLAYLICFISLEKALTENGQIQANLWVSGSIVYGAVVIIPNLKILEMSHNHTGILEVLAILSIFTYYATFWLESKTDVFWQIYLVFPVIMRNPLTYFVTFLCASMVWTIDKFLLTIWEEISRMREKTEMLKASQEKDFFGLTQQYQKEELQYHGFAFSKESFKNTEPKKESPKQGLLQI